jgi:transcriptional regulator with GAF, ATPase, and Fis domain
MLDYHWPGNVREVEAWSHRLVADAANGEMIVRESALNAIGTRVCVPPPAAATVETGIMIDPYLTIHEAKNEVERLFIINTLNETGCNLSQSAKRLGMSLLGLKKAIKRLGIEARASVAVSSTKKR